VVEGARLESVYTSKGYRGFESLSLRQNTLKSLQQPVNRMIFQAVFFWIPPQFIHLKAKGRVQIRVPGKIKTLDTRISPTV
jgi:hypothetical protein